MEKYLKDFNITGSVKVLEEDVFELHYEPIRYTLFKLGDETEHTNKYVLALRDEFFGALDLEALMTELLVLRFSPTAWVVPLDSVEQLHQTRLPFEHATKENLSSLAIWPDGQKGETAVFVLEVDLMLDESSYKTL